MRNSALRVLRAVSNRTHPETCRFVAGCRVPSAKNTFHTTTNQRREDDPAETAWNTFHEQPPPSEVARPYEPPVEAEGLLYNLEGGPETPSRPRDRNNYGSAARRAGRNIKRVKELPPVDIPPWFLDGNVTLRKTQEECKADPTQAQIYDDEVLTEIVSVVSAGLQVPSWQRAEIAASLKPHPMLYCPKDGTELPLANQVQFLAAKFNTDLLTLNPQDIAEIGGDYMDESQDFQANTLSSLGYDAPLVAAARYQQAANDAAEEDEYDEADEDSTEHSQAFPTSDRRGRAGGIAVVGGASFGGNLHDVFKFLAPPGGSPQKGKTFVMQSGPQAKDVTPESKMGLLVETLLNTPEMKRVTESSRTGVAVSNTADSLGEGTALSGSPLVSSKNSPLTDITGASSGGLIVSVQDYPQISTTASGSKFLDKLHEIVDIRRKEGQSILIIGATSSKDLIPSLTWSAAKDLQNQSSEGPTRTIVVPINTSTEQQQTFPAMHKQRMKDINIRHIRDMLRRTAPNLAQVAPIVAEWDLHMDSKAAFLSGLDESIWPMERVSRVAITALGASFRSCCPF